MLDKMESETESEIKNLLEDSNTKYIAEEPVPDNKGESHQLLTLEATFHSECKVLDKPPAKKIKMKVAELKGKRTSQFVKAKKCTLEAKVWLDMPIHCWYLKGL